ncbi:DUF4190 domain-containing protein [Curtobacterium sp. VKM Ac-1393]|uniref:DUF4190 domain-containing protein n=1 Tax=Curtobacterium sp. VKM Ac-1393 TaxID=2783814 RepID=UPI00188DBA00|nr:DUF4190 domain-containing protein [Curtobacterium sp. VKM Ac-1393]MBF4607497.1 DUF4190 domain-containing protein [Curtobacterium sp. VKM Ac-1393]
MTDLAPASSGPDADTAAVLAPLSLLAVVAIALAFVAPIGGVVVGFIARHEVRRTDERGDGLAFAAILIGATLTLFGLLVPGALALSGLIGTTIRL